MIICVSKDLGLEREKGTWWLNVLERDKKYFEDQNFVHERERVTLWVEETIL